MKLPSLFKSSSESSSSSSSSPWPWPLPTCGNYPKTLSFRAHDENHDHIFKTLNTSYLDDSCYSLDLFSQYSHETSFSHTTICDVSSEPSDYIETVISGLKSEKERLFYEPEASKNINNNDSSNKPSVIPDSGVWSEDIDDVPIFKESVAMALDSKDPFVDFKRSMEEMVEAHGIQDWECLEELLTCYLKVNCKSNHGYIVGAFVDLLVSLDFTQNNNDNSIIISDDGDASTSKTINNNNIIEQCLSSTTSTTSNISFTSPLSFCSSSTSTSTSSSTTSACLSLLEEVEDDDDEITIIHKNISVSYPL